MTEQDRDDTTQDKLTSVEEPGAEAAASEGPGAAGGPAPADMAEESAAESGEGIRVAGGTEAESGPEAENGPEAAGGGAAEGGEVQALRDELESLNERHLRLAAEFDNYRKRNQRDREVLATRLQAELVGSLLDVLDDLQRVRQGDEEVQAGAVLEGVRLVERKFMTVLESAGLTPVDAEGEQFDPEQMEALGTVPTDDPERDGHVADVFQRGYRLRDQLLRPARVRVYQHETD